MVGEIVGVVIVRRALAFPVVVDDQIARQSHQPVLQVPLFGVVLIQRAINSDKNFLGQIFGGVCSGGKSVGEVVNATGIVLDDLFPSRAVARATPANQSASFANCCQRLNSPHVSSPGTLGFGNLRRPTLVSSRLRHASSYSSALSVYRFVQKLVLQRLRQL